MHSLLGSFGLEEEMPTTSRFIWLFILKLASSSSCIQETKVEVVGQQQISSPSMLTGTIFLGRR
jgi:hypothetical protein